jgi:hypothetical protein
LKFVYSFTSFSVIFYVLVQQFDIAILTIDPPVSSIEPVCFPPASTAADQFAGKDAYIMGWGRMDQSKDHHPFK